MNRLNVQGVLLSLPSLRVGTITAEMIDQISQGQRRGFTIAPEAATQRMRNRINKKIREEDIFEITKEIVARKWLSLKLYFMIGLPGEVQEDIEAIAQLSHRLKKLAKHKSKITISIATFIPKPHTPFQWEEQISLSESRKKIDFLRKKAQRYGFYLRWHNPEQSLLEGVFARGDRRLHEVVLRAWLKGARFDSWQDRFQFALWQTAFEDTKIDPKFYLEKKGKDTIFPWKKIDIGVSADFLWQEKLKSEQEEITLDCRYDSCQSCGLCDFKKLSPILYKEDIGKVPKELSSNIFSPHKYRFTFTKLDDARFFSHLEVINIFHRAFKMAGLKLVYSNGFHPLPKISFAIALPVGVESLAETMDVEIYGEFDEKILIKKINQHLPSGLSFLLAKKIPLKTPLATPFAQRFVVDFSPVGSPKEKIDDFGKKESFIWQTKHNSKLRQLDLKKIVKKLTLKGQQRIEIVLLLLPSGSIKITEALRAIFDLKKEEVSKLRILKVGDNLDI
jgi:radical SAM-linked protein